MPLGQIGAILLVLVAVVVLGNLWFSLVEGVLNRIKCWLTRHQEPPAWHSLPPEQQDNDETMNRPRQ